MAEFVLNGISFVKKQHSQLLFDDNIPAYHVWYLLRTYIPEFDPCHTTYRAKFGIDILKLKGLKCGQIYPCSFQPITDEEKDLIKEAIKPSFILYWELYFALLQAYGITCDSKGEIILPIANSSVSIEKNVCVIC